MGRRHREILFLTRAAPDKTATPVKRSPAAPPIARFALAGVLSCGVLIALAQSPSSKPSGPAPKSPGPAAARLIATNQIQKGFSFPYQEGGRVVFRFSGSQYRALSLTELSVEQFTLETFNTNSGLAEWVGIAPQCVVSTTSREVHSAGPVTLKQADGQFSLSGVGFSWSHAADRLVISNKLHATFHTSLFSPLQ